MPKTKGKRRYIPKRVVELVKTMELEQDKWICWTVECGLHSGILPCCIMFYVMMYRPTLEDEHLSDELSEDMPEELDFYIPGAHAVIDYRFMLRKYSEDHGPINYIPCPSCFLAKKFVKLKECDCYRKRTYPLLH